MNREERLRADVRKTWFKNHEVLEHSTLEDENGNKVERLVWGQKGTNIFRMVFLRLGGRLFVCGDAGEAAFGWHSSIGTLENMAHTSLDYFAGKCQASEEGRSFREWDDEQLMIDVKAMLTSEEREDYGYKTWEEFCELGGRSAINEDRHVWRQWLYDNGDDVFGQEWYECGLDGMYYAYRLIGIHEGLKMAFGVGDED